MSAVWRDPTPLRRSFAERGATPIAGDIASPERWAGRLPRVDAVIHAASDFSSDMGAIDRRLLDVLLPSLAAQILNPGSHVSGIVNFEVPEDAYQLFTVGKLPDVTAVVNVFLPMFPVGLPPCSHPDG